MSQAGDKIQTTETPHVQDQDTPPDGASGATRPPATPATGQPEFNDKQLTEAEQAQADEAAGAAAEVATRAELEAKV